MSPLRATISALDSIAFCMIMSAGCLVPRSTTSNPLQRSNIATMFLPMSCTSPFTVARITFGEWFTSVSLVCEADMKGARMSTACCIASALRTTCGRNIRPAPKSSPTTPIPFISDFSTMSSGRSPASMRDMIRSLIPLVVPCIIFSASSSEMLPVVRASCVETLAFVLFSVADLIFRASAVSLSVA